MAWGRSNAARKPVVSLQDTSWSPPAVTPAKIDWERLVTMDFETYYDDDYTLKKLSTSEYIRDKRFKAQMVGIKIGSKPTKCYPANKVAQALKSIPWATHSLLCHHTHFDGMILWEHYGISPLKLYDTLSMARALHSNEISARLGDVSIYYGGEGKRYGDRLDETKGVLNWSKTMYERTVPYCTDDVEETLHIFKEMLPRFPAEEIELIDHICRMFTEPVLGVDRPRVQKELEREIEEKRQIMLSFVKDAEDEKLELKDLRDIAEDLKLPLPDVPKKDLKQALFDTLPEEALQIRQVKKLIGSQRFADLLRAEGVDPPVKISDAWKKMTRDEKEANPEKKWSFAFAKTDMPFVELQEHENPKVRALCEARVSVKSTTNETRAGRFLAASENGAKLPIYLKYSAAHTHRLGGGNKMNPQNLKRGGELRKSIMAPNGDVVVVVDSGQIEARVNAWLWGQEDLLDDFRKADRKEDRDAYCKFADLVYGRRIEKGKDDIERFVGKTCILGLGYQMGAERLRKTLALGTQGPQVFITEEQSRDIVRKYRTKNFRIKTGWGICQRIIEQMATGVAGSWKCIAWDKETLYLPNGMTMHYPNLRDDRFSPENTVKRVTAELTGEDLDFDPDWPQFVYDTKEAKTKLYGGKMCENIVQALARIIVMNQCLHIVKTNKQVKRWVMSTHDEGAFLTKAANGAKVYQACLGAFSTPPLWASDLPLNADGGFDVIYSK